VPAAISNAFLKAISSHTRTGEPIIAPRDAAWQVTDVVVDQQLAFRRFIEAGHSETTWFVWYERGGYTHSFYLALFNERSQNDVEILVHLAVDLKDLCSITQALILSRHNSGNVSFIDPYW